jgi:hypothetical protein
MIVNTTNQTIVLDPSTGRAEWIKGKLRAVRSYHWQDRLLILDETVGRVVVDDVLFSTYDLTGWTPVKE